MRHRAGPFGRERLCRNSLFHAEDQSFYFTPASVTSIPTRTSSHPTTLVRSAHFTYDYCTKEYYRWSEESDLLDHSARAFGLAGK